MPGAKLAKESAVLSGEFAPALVSSYGKLLRPNLYELIRWASSTWFLGLLLLRPPIKVFQRMPNSVADMSLALHGIILVGLYHKDVLADHIYIYIYIYICVWICEVVRVDM